MNIMAKNKTGDTRIRARVPPGVWVAEKTGTLGKHLANDAGYMGWDGSEIALTCFTWSNAETYAEALIADAARAVFDVLGE
ncbi:MAG: serine hydrolase [Leptolyngbya sp. SIO1E4]|nr:serine hydrolase [Leptolyngbya sp. SIO1E4]